ncbi:MAG: peptide deformylase [Bacteroidales bacterium]|nr:peptide deformylase [Bacteroidales bacterium]
MKLPVYAYGTPELRKVTKDIESDYPDLEQLISDMFETMHSAEGVGLAAPQVGKLIRLFLVDARIYGEDYEDLKDFKKVFINARILEKWSDEVLETEGCLSIPKIHEDVYRSDSIRIKYMDEDFTEHEVVFEGMAARIIQHEYDHLGGILFTDKLSPLKRRLIRGKLKDISIGKVNVDYKMIFPKKK